MFISIKRMKTYFVYIISNESNRVLYIGVTSDLVRRIYEHKNKLFDGFSSKYNLNKLVYFETTDCIASAIEREKQLKNWKRSYKDNLIQKNNPLYNDLYNSIVG